MARNAATFALTCQWQLSIDTVGNGRQKRAEVYQIRPITRHQSSRAIRLATFCALFVSLMTAAQVILILTQGEAFCPSDGCRMVERTTKVSPLVFNLVGLCFFQLVYWGLRSSRAERHRLPRFVAPLLLAGLSVEAVLVGFQFFVTHTFCIYCLVVLAGVVLLNLLLGFRQASSGALVFTATLLAFASLEHGPVTPAGAALTSGVLATRQGTASQPEHHLFYSSTCPHCEQIMAMLHQDNRATVRFHPIDADTAVDVPQAVLGSGYSFQANKALLVALGIDEVPVLITPGPDGMSVVRGAQAIVARLGLAKIDPPAMEPAGATSTPVTPPSIPGLESQDGCQVSVDCTDETKIPPGQAPATR